MLDCDLNNRKDILDQLKSNSVRKNVEMNNLTYTVLDNTQNIEIIIGNTAKGNKSSEVAASLKNSLNETFGNITTEIKSLPNNTGSTFNVSFNKRNLDSIKNSLDQEETSNISFLPSTESKEQLILNKIQELEESGLLEIDCSKKVKAKDGLRSKFKKGKEWKLVKDLKGYPTHEKGGVDLSIGKGGVKIHNGKTEFKAEFGLVISNENGPPTMKDKIVSTLNPKNWGVSDYSDKGDFDTAYSSARKEGEKEFMWNNKRYNTNYKGTPKQQIQETGITDDQLQDRGFFHKRFFDNMYPRGYESDEYGNPSLSKTIKRVSDAVVFNNKDPKRNELIKEDISRMDAFSLYSGVPQKNNTFNVSKYRPTKSKEDIFYYSVNNDKLKDDLVSNINNIQTLSDYEKYFTPEEINILKEKKDENAIKTLRKRLIDDENFDLHNNYLAQTINKTFGLNFQTDPEVMGNFKVDKGSDDRGEYISYYDKWDLAPLEEKPQLFGVSAEYENKSNYDYFGKPFEIYDRIYVKDYGDGKKKRMYYSDKELEQLNSQNKDFDTLALQKELANRGYKLPNSTKKDNTFDGIWGDETKNALLDYQSKNKIK